MFLAPFALVILIGSTARFGSSERLSCLGASPPAAGAAASFLEAFFAGLGAAAAAGAGAAACAAGAAAAGTSLVLPGSVSAMAYVSIGFWDYLPAFASFARWTPTVLRGPFRVRALVLVRCPRTGRPRR